VYQHNFSFQWKTILLYQWSFEWFHLENDGKSTSNSLDVFVKMICEQFQSIDP
jgi:hypothetical protein